MTRTNKYNNNKRRIFPSLWMGGILLTQHGSVCQVIEDQDPRAVNENSGDASHFVSDQQERESSSQQIRNQPDILDEARFHPSSPDGETAEMDEPEQALLIHTDYIHQVVIVEDEENKNKQRKPYDNSHHQHSVVDRKDSDPEIRAAEPVRPLDSIPPRQQEEEESNIPTFTIEQLRTLLQTLEGEQTRESHLPSNTNTHRSWKSSDLVDNDEKENIIGSKIMEDDRTLLDVFGEAAKQFLTQKVIPETNPECKWDWRSLNCEPICECEFHLMLGDYHLGRACRLRTQKPHGVCQSVDPAYLLEQTTLSQRIGWMMRRTWIGIRRRYGKGVKASFEGLKEHSLVQLNELQQKVCSELWELLYNNQIEERKRACWSMTDVPSVSITQRLLCGPLHFQLCDDFMAENAQTSPRTEYA